MQITAQVGADLFHLIMSHYTRTTGTFTIDNARQICFIDDNTASFSAAHGTLTISATSPDFVGTYSYTRVDSGVVTGAFDVLLH